MKKNTLKNLLLLIAAVTFFCLLTFTALAAPKEKIHQKTKCPVCGMFVVKYPNWTAQLHHKTGTINFFDGVKDLMFYYFNPSKVGNDSRESISEIWVKDYYTMAWVNGKKAFYVIGSDVYGPMGYEFIPFSSKEAAKVFMKDHRGDKILAFDEITVSIVEKLQTGQKMK